MTEDEAKTKWCPQSRLLAHTYSQDGQGRSFEGGYSYNRSPDPDEQQAPYLPQGASCIGSACMAWRWLDQKAKVQAVAPNDRRPAFVGPLRDYQNNPNWIVEPLPPEGHCGLAGTP